MTVAESFKKLEEWHLECQRYGAKRKFVKILVASKCDLEEKRTVTEDEARKFANANGMVQFPLLFSDNKKPQSKKQEEEKKS